MRRHRSSSSCTRSLDARVNNHPVAKRPGAERPGAERPGPEALTDADVRTCVRVLRLIEADRSHLTTLSQEQRRELLTLAGLVTKPERHEVSRMLKGFRRAKRQIAQEHDRGIIERAGLRVQRRAKVYAPLWLERPKPEVERVSAVSGASGEFHQARNCYVCKQPFTKMHRYYDSMCEPCGEFNYAQARTERGPRRPLRAGHRRAREDRLSGGAEAAARRRACHRHHPLSCRTPPSATRRSPTLREFQERLRNSWPRSAAHAERRTVHAILDANACRAWTHVLNNACQTVRRPAGFFAHLLDARETRRSTRCRGVARTAREPRRIAPAPRRIAGNVESGARGRGRAPAHGEGLLHSAALSQRRYLDEDYQGR